MSNYNNDLLSVLSIGLAIYGLSKKDYTPLSNYDLAVQNGFTGSVTDYLESLKPKELITLHRQLDGRIYKNNIENNIVLAEWFPFDFSGVQDSLPAFKSMIESGKRIVFPENKTIYLSSPVSVSKSLEIDFNGCRIIAPNGLINFNNTTSVTSEESFFEVEKDAYTLPVIEGLTDSLKVGNVVIIRDTITKTNTVGNYYYGQVCKIVGYDEEGNLLLNDAIYRNAAINRIDFLKSDASLVIQNLLLDMTAGTTVNRGIYCYGFENVTLENITLYGNETSFAGAEIIAYKTYFSNCTAFDFVNKAGQDGVRRLGYGFAAGGHTVFISNMIGGRCKHLFSANSRGIETRQLFCYGFVSENPVSMSGLMSSMTGGGALLQHSFDLHGNVHQAYLSAIVHTGSAGAVAVRNGNVVIDGITLNCLKINNSFKQGQLVSVYERLISNVVIKNAVLNVDSNVGYIPYLLGVQPGVLEAGKQGSILIDGAVFNGGKLFQIDVASAAGQNVSFSSIAFKNVSGLVHSLIDIKGSSDFKVNVIEKLAALVDVELLETTTERAVNVENCFGIREIDFSHSKIKAAKQKFNFVLRFVFAGGASVVPPQLFRFTNTYIEAGVSAIALNISGDLLPVGFGDFSGAIIRYNMNNELLENMAVGVYASLNNTFAKEWTFNRCYLINENSQTVTNGQGLNFPLKSAIDLSGLTFDTITPALNIGDFTAFENQIAAGRIPFNVRNKSGAVAYTSNLVFVNGVLCVSVSKQSNAGTAAAVPVSSVPALPSNVILYNRFDTLTEAQKIESPYAWIHTGSSWKPLI